MKVNKLTFAFFPYAAVAFIFFLLMVIPALDGRSEIEVYADSETYEKRYLENTDIEGGEVQLSMNYVGPLLILNTFSGNRYLIFLFNSLILILSIKIIKRSGLVFDNKYFWFLMLSPLTFISLVSVNKEIISLFVVAILVLWVSRRWLWCLLLALVVSYAVRWQLTMYIVVVAFAFFVKDYLKFNKNFVLFCLLFSVSICYYTFIDVFSAVTAVAFHNVEEVGKSGIYTKLNQLQGSSHLGYMFAFIPKVLQLNFGLISRYENFFDVTGAHNNIVMFLHSVVSFVLLCNLILFRDRRYSNNIYFVLFIYLIIFALSPIFSPRYFYPAYILGGVLLSSNQNGEEITEFYKKNNK